MAEDGYRFSGGTGGTGTSVQDADATTKGILQLAGDLGGTAASPTVPGKQPLNSDLTAIAGLGSGTAGVIVSDGAGWLRKSVAQMRTWLGLATVATSGAYSDLSGAPSTTYTIRSKTSAYTAIDGDLVVADATSGAFTVTLPASTAGRKVAIRKVDSSTNAVTVATTSGTIDGAATRTLVAQYQTQVYVADGTNWQRLDVPGVTAIAATGTAGESTFLRGDGAWAWPEGLPRAIGPVAQPASGKLIAARILGFNAAQGMGTSAANGTCWATPFVVSADCTVSTIGAGWHSAGTSGSLVRLGFYSDDGNFWPGALLLDAGTVSSASGSAGSIVISQALKAGRSYWAVLAVQGAPTTPPNVKASGSSTTPITNLTGADGQWASETTLLNAQAPWFLVTGVTGALPGTYPARTSAASALNAPILTMTVA